MPNNLRSNIELGAQIVIALAVLVAAGVIVGRNFFPAKVAGPANLPRISAGEKLTVPNVDWQQNQKSLVFFLKKDCAFCTASAPFYRELLAEASKRQVKSLALLPDPEQDAREYLTYLKLPIATIKTGPLEPYKITGTPTVVFVDSQGTVRTVWFGAARDREKEMRDKLVELFEAKN